MKRIKLDSDRLPWQSAQEVWPGYRVDGLDRGPDSGSGVFVKVLRRPEDGGGCWCALLRFVPPPGRALRVTAIARSDEEVFILSETSPKARSGTFICNPSGLRHGNTFTADTTAYVHYHGEPDQVLKIEVTDLADVSG